MFTGIVEELGTVQSRNGAKLRLACETVLGDVEMGASIAVNGCCLTVVGFGSDWWEADVTEESYLRTQLGDLKAGDPINLERPVRLSDRLGGHLVQGHVDGVGQVLESGPNLRIQVSSDLDRYMVEKGSVTVDGISLTIVRCENGVFTVAVIPHTLLVTTLGHRGVGDRVNIEVDVMAKYAEKLLSGHLMNG